MFSHGIIAGLLFAVVGRMVYDRTHTRELAELQAMNLSKAMPFAAVTFTIASVASMGLPGFSGFVAELQVLIGAWQAFPTLAVVAGVGIRDRRGLHAARAAKGVLSASRSRGTCAPAAGADRQTARLHPTGADLDPGAHRRGAADRHLAAHRALPEAAVGPDLAELQFAAL